MVMFCLFSVSHILPLLWFHLCLVTPELLPSVCQFVWLCLDFCLLTQAFGLTAWSELC